ncbi:MAG: hypothetical protein RML57_14930 [Acidobacteriota bacterium]|nr:hypothetical protein [Acidobacteriota bacterium]
MQICANVTSVLQNLANRSWGRLACLTAVGLLALAPTPVWAQEALPPDDAPEIKPIRITRLSDQPADQPAPQRPGLRQAPAGDEAFPPPASETRNTLNTLQPEASAPNSKSSSDALIPFPNNAANDPAAGDATTPTRFQWGEAFRQAMFFNALQHILRFATEDGTRKEIVGPFFRDWLQSIRNLRGWRDGDPFLVNYIGHPIMGAASGYIQIHNDPQGQYLEFAPTTKAYWKSRLKAMAWSAVYSTQFEIGPISEASLGNVGRAPRPDGKSPMAYVDLVITPTIGTLWLVGEDALDKHLIQWFERRVRNPFWRGMVRSFLNPGRSVANAMRFKWPWYRDRRKLYD